MAVSAKSVIRASSGGSFVPSDKEEDKEKEKNLFERYFDGLLGVRTMNRAAEFTGKQADLAKVSPVYAKDLERMEKENEFLESVLGIPRSTSKAFHDATQGLVDDLIISGKGLGEAVTKAVTNFKLDTTPQTGVSAKPVVYSDWSPVSRLFGMSQDTAFSEHMANTAHQREVADLKAAGLNPVLGISGSGASVTSGSVASSGSSSALKADSSPLLDIMGATSALVTSLVTKNPMYGYMVANIFKSFD